MASRYAHDTEADAPTSGTVSTSSSAVGTSISSKKNVQNDSTGDLTDPNIDPGSLQMYLEDQDSMSYTFDEEDEAFTAADSTQLSDVGSFDFSDVNVGETGEGGADTTLSRRSM